MKKDDIIHDIVEIMIDIIDSRYVDDMTIGQKSVISTLAGIKIADYLEEKNMILK